MPNRAERRRLAKQEQAKIKVYHLTQDQIDKMKHDAVNEAIEKVRLEAVQIATKTAFKMFMAIPTMVLRDKFGFGRTRLDRFMHYCMIWYESIQSGETELKELLKIAGEFNGTKVEE